MRSRDVVFALAPKVGRQELQYALRSLNFIPHGRVFIIGGKPEWVVNVEHVPFTHAEKWMALTRVWDVIRDLPLTPEFIYTEDDYFITEPVDDIPNYHQGPLAARVDDKKFPPQKTGWKPSLTASYRLLVDNGIPDPLSFDVHIPMVVELDRIPNWPSKYVLRYRDLVGNTASRAPVKIARDVKCHNPADVEKVEAAGIGFLSSADRTFIKSTVRDRLDGLFPEPCRYEKEFYVDAFEEPIAVLPETLTASQRVLRRRVLRNGRVTVQLESGVWVDEKTLPQPVEASDEEE